MAVVTWGQTLITLLPFSGHLEFSLVEPIGAVYIA